MRAIRSSAGGSEPLARAEQTPSTLPRAFSKASRSPAGKEPAASTAPAKAAAPEASLRHSEPSPAVKAGSSSRLATANRLASSRHWSTGSLTGAPVIDGEACLSITQQQQVDARVVAGAERNDVPAFVVGRGVERPLVGAALGARPRWRSERGDETCNKKYRGRRA